MVVTPFSTNLLPLTTTVKQKRALQKKLQKYILNVSNIERIQIWL